jgi:hypothetical protein
MSTESMKMEKAERALAAAHQAVAAPDAPAGWQAGVMRSVRGLSMQRAAAAADGLLPRLAWATVAMAAVAWLAGWHLGCDPSLDMAMAVLEDPAGFSTSLIWGL